MDSHKPLHLKTFAMILIMITAGPLGNVLLGKGMKSVGSTSVASLSDLMHLIERVFTSEYVWLGVASLLTFFVANLLARTLGVGVGELFEAPQPTTARRRIAG